MSLGIGGLALITYFLNVIMKLFTKTYRGDLEWLKLAIKTVDRFCQQPLEWTMVVEDEDLFELRQFIFGKFWEKSRELGPKARKFSIYGIKDYWPEAVQISNGYLRQQWIKMNAHKVMGNDFFLNWDSDVIAVRDFSEADFRGKSGRPIHWFTDYNHLITTEKDPTALTAYQARRALAGVIYGWPIPFEWMRCMPMPCFGEILRCGSGTPYWNQMFEMCEKQTPGFSEFNFIGEFANKFFPDAFEWRNAENSGPTWSTGYVQKDAETLVFQEHGIVSQGWSYGGIPDVLKKWVDAQ